MTRSDWDEYADLANALRKAGVISMREYNIFLQPLSDLIVKQIEKQIELIKAKNV